MKTGDHGQSSQYNKKIWVLDLALEPEHYLEVIRTNKAACGLPSLMLEISRFAFILICREDTLQH